MVTARHAHMIRDRQCGGQLGCESRCRCCVCAGMWAVAYVNYDGGTTTACSWLTGDCLGSRHKSPNGPEAGLRSPDVTGTFLTQARQACRWPVGRYRVSAAAHDPRSAGGQHEPTRSRRHGTSGRLLDPGLPNATEMCLQSHPRQR